MASKPRKKGDGTPRPGDRGIEGPRLQMWIMGFMRERLSVATIDAAAYEEFSKGTGWPVQVKRNGMPRCIEFTGTLADLYHKGVLVRWPVPMPPGMPVEEGKSFYQYSYIPPPP